MIFKAFRSSGWLLLWVAASSCGPTTVPLYRTAQGLGPPKVLFDGAHAQTAGNADWVINEEVCGIAQRFPSPPQSGITASTPETYWSGAYSAFGVDAAKGGFLLESLATGVPLTYGDATNPQDLSNYDVFVSPEPNIRFTAAEITAITAFVQAGGGLFMISDHAGSDRNNDGWDSPQIWNDLGSQAKFGIHFQMKLPSGVFEPNSNFSQSNTNLSTDPNSPIIFGTFGTVRSTRGMGIFNGTSLILDPVANAAATAHIWMNAAPKGSLDRVTFASATYGLGRVAAVVDSSPSEDPTNNCGHTTYPGWTAPRFDNAIIHLNALAWLAAKPVIRPDAGVIDAGIGRDAGTPDADAGTDYDSGVTLNDAGSPEDSGTPGSTDAGGADGGRGSPKASGCGCQSGSGAAGWLGVLGLVLLVRHGSKGRATATLRAGLFSSPL